MQIFKNKKYDIDEIIINNNLNYNYDKDVLSILLYNFYIINKKFYINVNKSHFSFVYLDDFDTVKIVIYFYQNIIKTNNYIYYYEDSIEYKQIMRKIKLQKINGKN